ncbi:MAG: hypothetical protein JWO03_2168 [Bacteroidetes bacterium]|nr:hypothetical protein [Bacteroidota bacterium]
MVTDSMYVQDIQQEFQKSFAFLKIEFFKNSVKNENNTMRSSPISGKMLVGNVRHIHVDGSVDIDESRSVIELENDFLNSYGLLAQVFRKSGSMWIETTLTDHWSLQRQNEEGRQMS